MSSYSGEAAEQIVRMSLEGAEVVLKLTGSAAKHLAICLYSIAKGQEKTKGRIRLGSLLRSGKELKVLSVKSNELERFQKEANRYGVLYSVLVDRKAQDGNTDLLIRAEDMSKVNRIFERFSFSVTDKGNVRAQIVHDMKKDNKAPEQEPISSKDDPDRFIAEATKKVSEEEKPNPGKDRPESRPSGNSLLTNQTTARDDSGDPNMRSSVKAELEEIRKQQKQTAAREQRGAKQLSPKQRKVKAKTHEL